MGAILEIGATLREARERRHLTPAEVEAATMIPARYLEALEHERYERLPDGLYRRSFLREYAEYLGLNGDLYVVEYDLETAPPEPPPAEPPRKTVRVPVRGIVLGTAVVLALAGLWWLGRGGHGAPAPVAVSRAPVVASPAPPVTTSAAPAVRAAPQVLRLVAATGDCWLSVRLGSANGPLVYERTLRQGESVVFGLRRRLLIRMGAPQNLGATLDGRPITASLPARTADVVVTSAGLTLA